MSNPPEDDHTAVTVYFQGKDHISAANAFIIQFSDGGLDEELEWRLEGQGHYVEETGFDVDGRGITIVLGEKPKDGSGS